MMKQWNMVLQCRAQSSQVKVLHRFMTLRSTHPWHRPFRVGSQSGTPEPQATRLQRGEGHGAARTLGFITEEFKDAVHQALGFNDHV